MNIVAGYVAAFVVGYLVSMLIAVGLARAIFPKIEIGDDDQRGRGSRNAFPVSKKLRTRIHHDERRAARRRETQNSSR